MAPHWDGAREEQAEPRSLWRRIRESDLVVMWLITAWIFVVMVVLLLPMMLFLPVAFIPGVGPSCYRHVTGIIDYYCRQICMCIPFSWCRMRCVMFGSDFFMRCKEKGNSVILANHCSRIDWVGAVYVGMCGRPPTNWRVKGTSCPRVNFVAEVTTAIMPIVGWSRFLFGDILLQRAFHKDGPRILKNIATFNKEGIDRCIFLAPEGTIVDPGMPDDEKYIENCKDFMKELGKEPMKYLLSPRYKGMTSFVTHAPNNVAAATLAFVQGQFEVDSSTGKVSGGKLYTRKLDDSKRKIPDLHDIFTGDLTIFINFQPLIVSDDGEAVGSDGQSLIKTQLIDDQIRKDNDLAEFELHGKWSAVKAGSDWLDLRPIASSAFLNHLYLNAAQLVGLLIAAKFLAFICGSSMVMMGRWFFSIQSVMFLFHAISYKGGQWLTDGVSRESLVGETAIKALLALLTGRSTNQGGKKKD